MQNAAVPRTPAPKYQRTAPAGAAAAPEVIRDPRAHCPELRRLRKELQHQQRIIEAVAPVSQSPAAQCHAKPFRMAQTAETSLAESGCGRVRRPTALSASVSTTSRAA